MLTVHQLAKSFALTTLFENVTFSLNNGDRVGLAGPNGCGKTTLLRLLTGELAPDSGHVTLAPGTRLGYLPQGFTLPTEETLETVIGRAAGDAAVLEDELIALATQLAHNSNDTAVQQQYDTLLQRLSRADTGRAATILAGLGLDNLPPTQPVGLLSGGQKTRLNLALVLLGDPQLLLLDEPTNHLDIAMLEWLETWLAGFDGGVLLVSHDHTFLDNTVSRILALDPLQKTVREYAGNYSAYEQQRLQEREKQWAAYHDQQAEIKRVREDIQRVHQQAERTEREASSISRGGGIMKLKGYKDYQQGIAKKVAAKAKARESKLEKYLDSEERVEKPKHRRSLRLDFAETDHLGRFVLRLQDLAIGYDRQRPLLSHLRLEVLPETRIVISGANGSGKTTLLRTLAGTLPPLAGRVARGPSVNLGIMSQEQTHIDPTLTPLTTLRHAFPNETAVRTFLAYFLLTGDEPLLPNDRLSFGQRARLALAKLVVEGCNVLLLDEPINHLDIDSRAQFEEALATFNGTVLAVVHDRAFIDRFADEVWWLTGSQMASGQWAAGSLRREPRHR